MLRLVSLSALFVSTSSFFFGSSGCGCVPAPMCLPMCPPPPPPPICGPVQACVPAAPAIVAPPPPLYQPPPPAYVAPPVPQPPVYQGPPQFQPEAPPVGPQVAPQQPPPGYAANAPVEAFASQNQPVQPQAQMQVDPQQEQAVNPQRDFGPEQRDMLISKLEQEAAAAAGQPNEEVIEEQDNALEKSETSFTTQSPIGSTTAEAVEERVVDIASLNLTDDPLCNSEDLRKLMLDNIDENLNSSKRLIQLAAEAQFGGRFDVICANGDFSYVTNTELFCQETKGDISCYTYRQL